MDDELLTVAQIATILRLHPQTIRNWIHAGTLPCVRLGQRRVRVYRSDLNHLIQDAATGHHPPTTTTHTDESGTDTSHHPSFRTTETGERHAAHTFFRLR